MPTENMLCCNGESFRLSGARSSRIRAGVILALCLGGGAIPAGTALALDGAGAEWTTTGGTPQGTRFSTLDQINPSNVGQLTEEFSFQTDTPGSHMGEPLVVGSTLYVVTPYPNKLIAYDLSKGQKKWVYSTGISEYAKGVNCCDTTNRGAAYADGKIVFNLLDNTTVAVDATTGKQVWKVNLADPHTGVTMTGAPIIAKGKVFVGTSSGEMGVRGWVQALDLKTGQKLWRAYSTGPDTDVKIGSTFAAPYEKDRGTDQGMTSWPGTTWKQGGSSTWAYLTYDPELDLLFYGTSQPGVWNADLRANPNIDTNPRASDNKWGASIFARKPDTGEAVWAYQVTPHDGWDYDAISENVAVNQTVNGEPRKLLVHFDKNGFAYTFDRATGKIVQAPKFGYVTWTNDPDIDPTTGLASVNQDKITHQGVVTEGICPSALGAKGWEPGAFSPQTGLFYVPTFHLCMNMHMLKAEYVAGAPYMGQDMAIVPEPGADSMSELVAWDAAKGEKLWGVKEPAAIYAGVLATAGGVVFYGTMDNAFKAVDANNGKVLFQTKLECSTVGNPISFTGPDGKQRIAVYSGVGWLAGGFGTGPCPGGSGNGGGDDHGDEHDNAKQVASSTSSGGGRVHVFKLP